MPKIPALLDEWLDVREIDLRRLNENELYSAALELKYDIECTYEYDDTSPQLIAAVTRYINRQKKTCKAVPLQSWY